MQSEISRSGGEACHGVARGASEAGLVQGSHKIAMQAIAEASRRPRVMTYVYLLQCIAEPDRFYVGFTDDLRARLKAYNSGKVPHTAKFKPWRVNTYLAFSDKGRAIEFEKYLKSHSGRAFARKRL